MEVPILFLWARGFFLHKVKASPFLAYLVTAFVWQLCPTHASYNHKSWESQPPSGLLQSPGTKNQPKVFLHKVFPNPGRPDLSDPRSRNHKSLAIANHNFEVASFSRRNRNKIAVLQVFSESQ